MATLSGYSGKPLWQKLGLKPGLTLTVINTTGHPVPDYWTEAPFAVDLVAEPGPGAPFLHLFTAARADLSLQIRRLVPLLAPDGTWWISWPKKASGQGQDVTEDTLRELLLPPGLVDVKVCSVTDALWSGLKLVWRRELRPGPGTP